MQKVKLAILISSLVLVLFYAMAVWHSSEPDTFDVVAEANQSAQGIKPAVGYTTTHTLVHVTEVLLHKSGGYLSNDVLPPFVMLDNMPAWELGALEMIRDLALSMRTDISRSQSQSVENSFLKLAQPKLNIDHRSWAVPAAEDEYAEALRLLRSYRQALNDPNNREHQFYARADNLRDWLKAVEKRLGSYSQRLSASVGQDRLNTDLAGDAQARQSTVTPAEQLIKTNWWRIDDEFYEARGAAWALLHFLKAIEVDFADVLAKKNATVSLQQIIRELEATQQTVWSPMVLNGSGFGLLANHSLVMANYISRANAALIELSELLSQG
ncbi:DUF2333 family protein [Rheinheimera sp.]|uniref:DUF2333 family protein n=1 Tax=Rheinheimera sp. TaxID=1869214 RepID=UPI0027BAF46B|nr:DUF2333 family protein [Rheinheimera sp.]